MENEEHLTFYTGPAYALVIGISDYEHFGEPGQELKDPQFPKLKVAHNDAQDFANFLKKSTFPEYKNVQLLINKEATLSNIKEAFETLRQNCRLSRVENPLVVVYFSGHGWPDPDGRNFLVPYEAQRNRLYSTALLNRDFSLCLDDLGTNRVVVFIDACQAGTIVEKGVKGPYDYVLPSEGRYIIASCGPMQNSYEWKEKQNSIFTGHLLQLLNCETGDFDKLEHPEIDISDLYHALREKVSDSAQNQYGAKQEPASEIKKRTGIALAKNRKVSDRKQKEIDEADARRFLDLICNAIMATKRDVLKTTIKIHLINYVRKQKVLPGLEDLYGAFDDQLRSWKKSEGRYKFDEGSEVVIDGWELGADAAPESRDSKSQQSATPNDELVTTQESATGYASQTLSSTLFGQDRPPTRTDQEVRPVSSSPYGVRLQAVSGDANKPPPAKVFVSYSHDDVKWLEQFKRMVAPLIHRGIIELWDDTTISPGEQWEEEIEEALASSKVAVLLVSSAFLESDFITRKEVPPLLNRARAKGLVIYWIMLSDCMVDETDIRTYQAAHEPSKPLDQLSDAEVRTVLKEIGQKLKQEVLRTK